MGLFCAVRTLAAAPLNGAMWYLSSNASRRKWDLDSPCAGSKRSPAMVCVRTRLPSCLRIACRGFIVSSVPSTSSLAQEAMKGRGMKIALLTNDAREIRREYDLPNPYFGTAPSALIDGFALMPD